MCFLGSGGDFTDSRRSANYTAFMIMITERTFLVYIGVQVTYYGFLTYNYDEKKEAFSLASWR